MSLTAHDLLKKRNNPEYLNFLAVGDALRILRKGLEEYAEKKIKGFHSSIISKLSGVKCNCSCIAGWKPSPHASTKTCAWATELKKFHCLKKKSRIPWHQSDSTKWHNPTNGYWEVAKIFMSDLGENWSNVKDPSSTDITGLINLLIFCTHFKIQQPLLKSVRGWRNKLAHAPDQRLSERDKQLAFKDIVNLMNDVELKSCSEVQECRAVIEEIRTADVSILQENELLILKELRHFTELEVKKSEIRQRRKEAVNEKLCGSEKLQKPAGDDPPRQTTHYYNIFHFTVFLAFFQFFMKKSTRLLKWFLLVVFFVSQVGDKSDVLLDNECIRAIEESPISHFHFQEFNFSSYLSYKRENFFGRKWLFRELEDIFETGRGSLGVLIIGEPGSGKSALMSQLICSPFSTMLIHNNIIGYHLCDYSERGKRDGARFVRNLVDQIAGRIPEYSYLVTSNEQIRRELHKRCESDPIGCFHGTILGPLRDLKTKPNSLRYILIDALDECIEKDGKTSTILDILSSKISQFPTWLKVILSTRNWTMVNTKVPRTVKRMPLNPTDERNLEDIRSYIKRFLSQNLFFMDRLLEALGLKSTSEGINSLINELSRKGEGNFLFVKTTLQYLNDSEGGINLQSFPTSLYDTYDIFFKRHFGEDDFSRFKALFEILLAAGSPLQLNEIDAILELQNQTQDVSKLVEHVSSFLRFGPDGTVRIFHQFFAEWLVDQAKHTGGLSIRKSRGHQYIADYLFDRIRKRNTTLTFEELSELSMHVVSGGTMERHRLAAEFLNVSETRDPQNDRCILHDLAVKDGTFPLLEVFLPKFVSVDVPDVKGKTPAFYAASEGNVDNLKLFIDKGTDINCILKNFPSLDPISTIVQNKGIEDFSMIHIAALKGHTKIVELLLKSNASYAKPIRNEPAPLHLAAGTGHLDVVKLLYDSGAQVDVISLHHAAARNHSAVVEFLLKTGNISDECLPCNSNSLTDFIQNATIQEFHTSFCETALHAAVARHHIGIVKLLLSFGKASLECKHYSGKTPLMDAVERNDVEMVELLLNEGADVEAKCGNEASRDSNEQMCTFLSMYRDGFLYTVYCEKDICGCGNKAIHLCARYGLWEMAEKLIYKWNAGMLDRNCKDEPAWRIAMFFDQEEFIYHYNRTLRETALLSLNDKAMILSATFCGSTKTLKLFASNIDISTVVFESGMTPLHEAAFWSPYPGSAAFSSCSQFLGVDSCCLAEKIDKESKKRMASIKLLVESQKNISSFLNEKDKKGKTALHYAALTGFSDAVKYLVEQGSNLSARDRDGRTPVMLALGTSPMDPAFFAGCHSTSDGVFTTCNSTTYDETTGYLIWMQRFNIKICDKESAELLSKVITKRMALSLYSLLKVGVDQNCDVEQSIRPFLLHLNLGGPQISEVFKIFEFNVSVECGVPFRDSVLHLMSYSSVPDNVGNFFKPSVNNRSFPLQRLINSHPKGVRIFDECRDAEGYLAIHRAAQGGNLDAIEWFISTGVDILQKTWSGLTALDLSILYLGNVPYSETFFSVYPKSTPLATSKFRRPTFEKLLQEFLNMTRLDWTTFQCDSTFERLSPLHIAALRGVRMLKFAYKKIRRIVPSLPFNCINKHKIDPLYLAYFYESAKELSHNQPRPLETVDYNKRWAPIQYPDREAEYHIVYNYFYDSPDENANIIKLQEILKDNQVDVTSCPGFSDLLPKRKTLDEMTKCLDYFTAFNTDSESESKSGLQSGSQSGSQSELRSECIVDCGMVQYRFQENQPVIYIPLNRKVSPVEKYYQECLCAVFMRRLQLWSTRLPRKNRRVSQFIATRMGWEDISADGDVQDRWPFYFLYKKAIKNYKSYEYLKVLSEGLELNDSFYDDDDDDNNDEEDEKTKESDGQRES